MSTTTLSPERTNGTALHGEALASKSFDGINRRVDPPHKPGSALQAELELDRQQRRQEIHNLFRELGLTDDQQRNNIESLGGSGSTLDELTTEQLCNLQDSLVGRTPPDEPERSLCDRIHEAFEHVCYEFACPLPKLLAETRKRGLADVDVKAFLQDSESDGDSGQFSAWRTGSGDLFLQCLSGKNHTSASVHELFAEVETSGDRQEPPSFILSDHLRQCGEELTEIEVVILDVAQTLNKKFKDGLPVTFRQVRRIVLRYHRDAVKGAKLRPTAERLVARGLCHLSHSNFRLVRHFETAPKPAKSVFAKLGPNPMQQAILIACEQCAGTGFRNRNVASRAAVRELMKCRHNSTRGEFNKLVRGLIESGILEEIPSKGSTAFRLTVSASRTMGGKVAQTEVEAADETPVETDDLLQMAMDKYGQQFSELACRVIAVFWDCCQVDQAHLTTLFRLCEEKGINHRDARRAIGELNALEYVFVDWCANSDSYFLTVANLDTPFRSGSDIVSAWDHVSKDLKVA